MLVAAAASSTGAREALAQVRVQPTAPGFVNGVPAASIPPSLNTTIPQGGYGAPAATLGTPGFDPYGSGYAAQGGYATPPPIGAAPANGTIFGNPNAFQTPAGAPAASPFAGIGTGTFVDPAYPTSPPVLYPTPWGGTDGAVGWGPGGMFPYPAQGPYLKVFQDARITYEWLGGGEAANDFDVQNIEIATTINFPNFLYTTEPLQVTPGFIFMFFDGPDSSTGADMPARAYGSYVDFGYQTNPNYQVGFDLNFRIGVYSDFNTVTVDSIRTMGTGTFWLRATPNLTLVGGVTYLDRVDIKILPVAGVIWRPNQFTNLELVFPYPRLSVYAATIGNTDVWWTAGAEYGGTSLTVERVSGLSERVDYNDYRVFGGIQWYNRATTLKGFVEAGYVFERELDYAKSNDDIDLTDTYMLRAGIAY
jgi:hypothetical protein